MLRSFMLCVFLLASLCCNRSSRTVFILPPEPPFPDIQGDYLTTWVQLNELCIDPADEGLFPFFGVLVIDTSDGVDRDFPEGTLTIGFTNVLHMKGQVIETGEKFFNFVWEFDMTGACAFVTSGEMLFHVSPSGNFGAFEFTAFGSDCECDDIFMTGSLQQ